MTSLFCNNALNLRLQQRMMKCYTWSVLLYGVESYTLKAALFNRLEALEMWIHQRMLRVSWTDMLTIEKVLQRENHNRTTNANNSKMWLSGS